MSSFSPSVDPVATSPVAEPRSMGSQTNTPPLEEDDSSPDEEPLPLSPLSPESAVPLSASVADPVVTSPVVSEPVSPESVTLIVVITPDV